MPQQEPGTKRARPLPYQPNANLVGFVTDGGGPVTAQLSFSNSGPHARKASHFSVYNNLADSPSLTDYPARFPGQYTVDASQGRSVAHRGRHGPGRRDAGRHGVRPHGRRTEPLPAAVHR